MHFLQIKDAVEVAKSKAKPKILTLSTTCGHTMKLLCKQEKNGDLRKVVVMNVLCLTHTHPD